MRTAMIGTAMLLLVLSWWLSQAARPGAKESSQRAAQLAVSSQQKQLWQEAVAKGVSLEAVPLPERPVEVRKRVAFQDRKAEGRPTRLPEQMVSGMRIVSAPSLPEGRFMGKATVLRAEDQQLALSLGRDRVLVLNAKTRGGAVRAKAGEEVTLDYRVNDDPYDRIQVLAVKTEQGDALVSVLQGDKKPVTLQVPMFDLTARQVGKPTHDTMSVEVTLGQEKHLLSVGDIAEFKQAGFNVGLIASIAYEGERAETAEGNPYSITLVAWKSQ